MHTTTSTSTTTRRSPGGRRTSRSLSAIVATTAASFALIGCGSDDEDSGTAEPIEISAIDYAYVDVPETITAGTELALTNDSAEEAHEIVAIRLPDDEERSVADLVQLPPEELAAFFPGVETVIVAPPESGGMVVEGDGTLSEPGRYALICVIPTGADPDEYLAAAAEAEGGPPDVDGGPPHIVGGMYAEITVAG